jgi:hypothetical protein
MRTAQLTVVAGFYVLLSCCTLTAAESTILGIDASRFTINDQPTFLLGISYYAGLGAPEEFVRQDLDEFQRRRFNWLRVWATWESFGHDVSAVDARGEARQNQMERFRWLIGECDRRGLIVDVTLARGKRRSGEASLGHLLDFDSHQRAVELIVETLKPHRNWFLDLANERDVRDDRYVPVEELKKLRELVKRLDPERIVTASFGGHELGQEDIRGALVTAKLDFLAPHRPRSPESPGQTERQTRECLSQIRQIGRVVPILYQEPFRRGYTAWEPTAEDFLTDLRGAVAGGAAGWCFHNGLQGSANDKQPRRSFDLGEKRLVDQLDAQEQKVLGQAAEVVRSAESR